MESESLPRVSTFWAATFRLRLGCGADVRSSREDCPPPRDNPPSVRQSARTAGTELRLWGTLRVTTYELRVMSCVCLPWQWSRGPHQLGGLPGTQGQPSKCPAVGQACWNRAKAGHLLNLRLGSNELRLAVTPPLAVRPRSTPAGRTAWHPGTTFQVSGSRAGMLEQS